MSSFQCAVCNLYFERKEFFAHIIEHPQGMQPSDAYQKLEEKMRKQIMETWTFFDESKPIDYRSPLEPTIDPSKTHGMELDENDRYLTRVSDWARKFKLFQQKKAQEKKIEQWLHMSQPLNRSPTNLDSINTFNESHNSSQLHTSIRSRPQTPRSGANSPIAHLSSKSTSIPSSRANSRSATPTNFHSPLNSPIRSYRRHSTTSNLTTPKSSTYQMSNTSPLSLSKRRNTSPSPFHTSKIQEENYTDNIQSNISSYDKASSYFMFNFSLSNTIIDSASYRNDAAIILLSDNLAFIKDEKVAYIPLPTTDSIQDTYQQIFDFQKQKRIFHHISYAKHGHFYLWNSYLGSKSLMVQFNLLKNEWTALNQATEGKLQDTNISGGVLLFNRLTSSLYYIMGKIKGQIETNEIFRFHIPFIPYSGNEALTWEKVTTIQNDEIPQKRSNHSAVMHDQEIIVFGGEYKSHKGDVKNLRDCWKFSLETLEWNKLNASGSIPPPCSHHGACIVNEYMFVFGGSLSQSRLYFLNLHTLIWSNIHIKDSLQTPSSSTQVLIPINTSLNTVHLLASWKVGKEFSLYKLGINHIISKQEEHQKLDEKNNSSNNDRSKSPETYIFENGSLLVSTRENFAENLRSAFKVHKRPASANLIKKNTNKIIGKKRPSSASNISNHKKSQSQPGSRRSSLEVGSPKIPFKRKSYVPNVDAYAPMHSSIHTKSNKSIDLKNNYL